MAFQVCVPTTNWGEWMRRNLFFDYPGLGQLKAFQKDMLSWPSPAVMVGEFMRSLNEALRPLQPIALVMQAIVAVLNCLVAAKKLAQGRVGPLLACVNNLRLIVEKLLAYIPPIPYMIALGSIIRVIIAYLDEVLNTLLAIDARISQLNAIRSRAATLQDANLTLVANCVQSEVDAAKTNIVAGLQALMEIIGSIMAMVRLLADFVGDDALIEDLNSAEAAINEQAEAGVPGLGAIYTIISALRPTLVYLYRILTFPYGAFVEPDPMPAIHLLNP